MNLDVILEMRNILVERRGRPVLEIPSFSVYRKEIVSLIGPNGAGKTTLLHAVMHLVKAGGNIYFLGEKAPEKNLHIYRRNFALVMQEPMLFNSSVYNNVASGLKIRGMHGKEAGHIVKAELERFGICRLAGQNALEISGGEAQRANLARAFAVRPKILLLDEPFAALDNPTRESLIEDLLKIIRETHTTTIFATHDRSEAIRLSDRIAVMNNGCILQVDTPEAIMQRPADEFVASFAGTETILTGTVISSGEGTFMVNVSGKEIEIMGEARSGEHVTFGIRPENIIIATGSPGTISARNSLYGVIIKITPMDLYYKIHLDCGFPLISYVTKNSMEKLSLTEQKKITASFKATSIHIIRID